MTINSMQYGVKTNMVRNKKCSSLNISKLNCYAAVKTIQVQEIQSLPPKSKIRIAHCWILKWNYPIKSVCPSIKIHLLQKLTQCSLKLLLQQPFTPARKVTL